MKFNFKKIAAIGASVLMVGMSMGVAAAANFPAPFSGSAASSVGVVVGAAGTDDVAAGSISDYLEAKVTGTLVIPEGSWPVKTSSDDLELTESIKDVETYIDESDLSILADGILSNEKGDAKYEQFFYFDDAVSSSVIYTEDDDDNIGLFFKIDDGAVIARYVMDFTTNLESDIETADGELSDIEDKDITVLGKTYTITTANNGTSGVELVLMSGAEKATLANGETATVAGKTISVLVSNTDVAQFTIDGVELDKMAKGETVKLSDGTFLGVTDITYQAFAGGIMQATFHLGADKIEMNNGTTLKVNGETIGEAAVVVTSTEASSDISISGISITMTAEDDLFVGEGKKLSQAVNLDEPEVLFSQNWDIEFNGLDAVNTEEVTFKSTDSDKGYELRFKNYNGDSIVLPVVYATSTGLKPGEYSTDDDDTLVLNASATITDDDYFVLNTANPNSHTTDARSYVVRYRGSDKTTDSDPKVSFDIEGVETGRTVSLGTDGTFNIKLGGSTFNFGNTSAHTSNNFNITLTDTQLGYATGGDAGWLQMRTQYNALVTVNDTNTSIGTNSWIVKVDVDDEDKDGDEVSLATAQNIFSVTLSNDTSTLEVATGTVTSSTSFKTNPTNDDESLTRTNYGAHVSVIDTSTAPAQITATIPESVVNPLVYVTSRSVSGGAAIGSLVFKDSETGWRARNVILVGGTCINTATAEALNIAYGTCEAAFTSATGVGSGQYLIKSVGDAFESGRIALVVAGYNQADTTAAISLLRNQPDKIDTSAGNEYLGIVTATGSSDVTKV